MFSKVFLTGWLAAASWLVAQAQSATEAPGLVREGVARYDEGRYEQALAKYQQALAAAPGDPTARAELAMTYLALRRNAEAISTSRQLLQEQPASSPSVYATYGNALDANQQPTEALAAYAQGLRQHPTSYILFFNQGVTLAQRKRAAEALLSFRHAVVCNPAHGSSHLLLGQILLGSPGGRVPGVLALARFLVLEPTSPRAAQARQLLDQALLQGLNRTGDRQLNVNIPAESLKKNAATGDDFGPEEMLLSLSGALTFDAKNKDKTTTEKFSDQFSSLCQVLGERQGQSKGFTRQYYAPYFAELEKRGYLPALVYLIHASQPAAEAPDVAAWLAAHPNEMQVFREWSKTYPWPQTAL